MSWGEDVNGDHWKGDHMDREILERMKTMVEESRYTVALCGSGMMEEVGLKGLKREDRAYEIEEKYGASPEELFNIACYSRHPERFFQFYREEILKQEMQISPAVYELAAMERAGKLQCLVTINLHDAPIKAGVKHAICLHGSVYHNRCPRCGRQYGVDYMINSVPVPLCQDCHAVIRPGVSLFGEMVDSHSMSRTAQEISCADLLLLLGTSLRSDVYSQYIRYFKGSGLIMIHRLPRPLDEKADLVVYDMPQNVLPGLGYLERERNRQLLKSRLRVLENPEAQNG